MQRIFIPLLLSFFIWTANLFGQDQANVPEYQNGDFWCSGVILEVLIRSNLPMTRSETMN